MAEPVSTFTVTKEPLPKDPDQKRNTLLAQISAWEARSRMEKDNHDRAEDGLHECSAALVELRRQLNELDKCEWAALEAKHGTRTTPDGG